MKFLSSSTTQRAGAIAGATVPRGVIVGVLTSAMAASMILAGTQSASAAGVIDVSSDGVTYGSSYPGALFDSYVAMVPGDSQSKVFYVRNSGNEAGILRITMEDVTANDADFATALTVSVSAAGTSGAAASISKAHPCWELLDGQSVGPGQIVAVTAKVELGDLDGQAGQGATAAMTMRASLSAPAAAALGATACSSGPSSDVVALAPAAARGKQLTTLALPGDGAAATSAEAQVPQANTQLPTLAVPGGGATVDPNTWHLYQELLVLLMVLALMVGSVAYLIVAWLRRRRATGGSGA